MSMSNIDYNSFLKQITDKDYVLEELDDRSTTFKNLFDSAINNFTEMKQKYNENYQKMITSDYALKSEKKVLGNLQELRLKFDGMIENESEQIVALEKERDGMRKKYTETVDNYREKLLSIEEEFNRDLLVEQISEMKETEKAILNEIKEVMVQQKKLDQRMGELFEEKLTFEVLEEIKNQTFIDDEELQIKQKELDNINKFIKDLNSKLE